MVDLIIFIVLLFGTYLIGTKLVERKHYQSIRTREKQLLHLPSVTFSNLDDTTQIKEVKLVTGCVVVSIDYFKRFLAGIKNIFGGEITSCETLIDRARREAILRMKESAMGADTILNVRIETSTIGNIANKKNRITCNEILAYGTAVTFAQKR